MSQRPEPLTLLVLALALLQVPVSWWAASRAELQHTTYVFTPMVDVIPGSSVLTEAEALKIRGDLRGQVDARDMQQAYATLGSTLSLDDLLQGVEALQSTPEALDDAQLARITEILRAGQGRHQALWQAQDDILKLEAQLAQEVALVIEALPPEAQAEARAAASTLPSRGDGPAGPPPGSPAGGPPPKHGPPGGGPR